MSYFCIPTMPLTVKEKILAKIESSGDPAFVRPEFDSLGAYRQVSRAGRSGGRG